ncbi:hypothetical protein C8J57DRAFT_1074436 [Mycena rebaudengoi]|nr:hypothetical protein C8J57DRAFT_1074436 [Mycena rebaudengoi]
MLLNLRSHLTSYHGAMNALMLWDNRAPKRLVHILSGYGFSSSYSFLQKYVSQVSSDAIKIAIRAANDPSKITMLPYDNFNWTNHAWETSATHGTVTHDQVSALLVVLPCPPNTTAAALTSITNFESTIRTRHRLPAHQSLSEILPDQADQSAFFQNSVLHIAHILAEGEYFLPTYDQEQSSTRGNMLVIGHYYTDILRMPKSLFEQRNYFLLGDRLTTARARAAQDQRALDRSEDRIDNFSSFDTLSGIMHVCMNQVNNIGKNACGGEDRDSVSLQTLLSKLPNRSDINLRKIDFYAWLRFLDVVLRALVLKAAMTILHLQSPAELGQRFTHEGFMSLCTQISSQLLMPSVDKLEAEGIKKLLGHTASGHAVLLMHDLMTIREMRHAVKHGHPERMERMLKYWTPMFYAGGSYNYANELMELLHNLKHDWPADISPILRGGMLMNNDGGSAKFKETDIRVEQFNGSVKSHAHGANARPALLEKITPALGHVQELTEQMCTDLGIDHVNNYHAKVRQDKDVRLMLNHLCTEDIFNFGTDVRSQHAVIDLYRGGLPRLAGQDGGHAKHLRRHQLRSRIRHVNDMPPSWSPEDERVAVELHDLERELALDSEQPEFSVSDEEAQWAFRFHDD